MNKKDILPYHLFEYNGSYCLINVEKIQATLVDKATSKTLEKLAGESEPDFTMDMQKILMNLGLVSDNTTREINGSAKKSYSISNIALLLTQSCNLRCT